MNGQKVKGSLTRTLLWYCVNDSAAIAQQRKRILSLHNQITQAQQRRASVEEVEEDEPPAQETVPVSDVTNEPISALRNRLFTNRGKEEVTDSSTEHVLQHHRMLQDDISDAMLGMARSLKDRSVAFGEALKEDSKVVDVETILIITVD